MTERIAYLTVALERDIREDDLEPLLTAIRMLKGVLAVTPGDETGAVWTAEQRIRLEMQKRIWNAVS